MLALTVGPGPAGWPADPIRRRSSTLRRPPNRPSCRGNSRPCGPARRQAARRPCSVPFPAAGGTSRPPPAPSSSPLVHGLPTVSDGGHPRRPDRTRCPPVRGRPFGASISPRGLLRRRFAVPGPRRLPAAAAIWPPAGLRRPSPALGGAAGSSAMSAPVNARDPVDPDVAGGVVGAGGVAGAGGLALCGRGGRSRGGGRCGGGCCDQGRADVHEMEDGAQAGVLVGGPAHHRNGSAMVPVPWGPTTSAGVPE